MARVKKVITKKVKGISATKGSRIKSGMTKETRKAEPKMTITPKTQGQRLDAFIRLASLTKKEFCTRTGIPYSSLKKVCAGTTRLTEENLDKIRKQTNIFIPSLKQEKTKLFCWPVVARRRAS